jgi:hypothetical protein
MSNFKTLSFCDLSETASDLLYHPKKFVVTLTQNLLKSDVAQKVVHGKLILADS